MRYFLIFAFALLTACGSALPTVKPFKMDIQQGNVVTSKMLLQLRPGMTKSQVKFIMGSPLIVDSFHKNRWDYFYQLRQAGKVVEQRRVILDFDKDLLAKVRGDVVPEGTAGAATGNESSVAKTITVEPKPKQETSWTDKLKFWKKDEAPKALDPKAIDPKVTEKAPAAKSAAEETMREKTDALEANTGAASGDANKDTSAAEVPSVLAVPIGGVLAPDAPAADTPAIETPKADESPVITAPVIEPAPVEPAPVIVPPVVEAPSVEMAKPADLPIAEPAVAPKPATKADERLIFRMDKNLDLKNLQAPASSIVEPPAVESKGTSTTAKPKKSQQPLPPEEAPGYFERMLEKIGF